MTLETVEVTLDDIYVPLRLRQPLDEGKVAMLAEAILEDGLKVPVEVRRDGQRFVLVHGRYRIEALRSLGETSTRALVVHAKLA